MLKSKSEQLRIIYFKFQVQHRIRAAAATCNARQQHVTKRSRMQWWGCEKGFPRGVFFFWEGAATAAAAKTPIKATMAVQLRLLLRRPCCWLPLPLLLRVAVAAAAAAAATHCKCSPTARLSQDSVSATFGQHHYFHSSCLAWRVHKKMQKKNNVYGKVKRPAKKNAACRRCWCCCCCVAPTSSILDNATGQQELLPLHVAAAAAAAPK